MNRNALPPESSTRNDLSDKKKVNGNLLQRKPLIRGTIILTLAGFISRLLGFVHRMILTRLYSDAQIGLYQLISPVLAISFSLCAAGIQTSVSKHVAAKEAIGDHSGSKRILYTGIVISLLLSLLCLFVMYFFSEFIASAFLYEPDCANLIRIVSFSVPLGSIHSCINGYYYGIKKAMMPAVTQLIEQVVRIATLLILLVIYGTSKTSIPLYFAVIGLVIGEGMSMLVSLWAYKVMSNQACRNTNKELFMNYASTSHKQVKRMGQHNMKAHRQAILPLTSDSIVTTVKLVLAMAIPLSASRLIVNALAGMEAVSLPARLLCFGYTNEEALSLYGILTGMTLPLLFFPNAITNSVSVMLLPIISEADAENDYSKIQTTVSRCLKYCLLLGIICTLAFFFLGDFLGNLLFNNQMAANYLKTLSFLCPIMYVSSTLTGILHGLGKTTSTLIISVTGLFIRLLFIYFLVPLIGMNGYLYGLLISQALTAISLLIVYRFALKPIP